MEEFMHTRVHACMLMITILCLLAYVYVSVCVRERERQQKKNDYLSACSQASALQL